MKAYKVVYPFNDKYDQTLIHSVGETFECEERERLFDLMERGYIQAVDDEEVGAPVSRKKK